MKNSGKANAFSLPLLSTASHSRVQCLLVSGPMPCHRTTFPAVNQFAVFIRCTVYVSCWYVILCFYYKPKFSSFLLEKSSVSAMFERDWYFLVVFQLALISMLVCILKGKTPLCCELTAIFKVSVSWWHLKYSACFRLFFLSCNMLSLVFAIDDS